MRLEGKLFNTLESNDTNQDQQYDDGNFDNGQEAPWGNDVPNFG